LCDLDFVGGCYRHCLYFKRANEPVATRKRALEVGVPSSKDSVDPFKIWGSRHDWRWRRCIDLNTWWRTRSLPSPSGAVHFLHLLAVSLDSVDRDLVAAYSKYGSLTVSFALINTM
ncbi:MAG: hypothetical protein Q9174_006728, partial [Haloplaca sp. 1 TL-2023]